MVVSAVQQAKRLFVGLLLALAKQFSVPLDLRRESEDAQVQAAFRKVVRKVHPDKGGNVRDAQRLQELREAWEALRTRPEGQRPMDCQIQCSTGDTGRQKFEVHTGGAHWSFCSFVGWLLPGRIRPHFVARPENSYVRRVVSSSAIWQTQGSHIESSTYSAVRAMACTGRQRGFPESTSEPGCTCCFED